LELVNSRLQTEIPMFYSYAPWTLAILGALIAIAGFYVDIMYLTSCKYLLWTIVGCILCGMGFTAGRLILHLSFSSHTDFLTGLWNRRYFNLRLQEEEKRAARKKTPIYIALIDVDGFKRMNDSYGHAAGDALLIELAGILKRNIRGSDVLIRWGGDEFVIMFSDTSLGGACDILERIRLKVSNAFLAYGLTISAGVLPFEPGQDMKKFIIKADQLLYEAKDRRNFVITVMDL